jgi:anti-anti-sigma factor
LIVHSVSRFDPLHVEHHRDQIRALIDEGYRHLIFDLERTEYINSSGLGMLVEFHNSILRAEGTFKLLNIRPEIRWMLRQTHLEGLLAPEDAEASGEIAAPAAFDPLHEMMSGEILLLAHVNSLSEKALSLDNPLQIGKALLEGMMAALNSRRGALIFLTQQQERLSLVHWIDLDNLLMRPTVVDYPLKFDKLEYEILSRNDITMRQLPSEDHDPAHHLLHSMGFRNLLAAPIAGRLRQYGIVCIEIEGDPAQTQIARPLVRTMTQIGGLALEKTALLEQVELQKGELNDSILRLRHSNQALRDAGRLSAMGAVLTGLGHQLNNKLVPLIGYLQLLLLQDDLAPGVLQKLGVMRTASEEIQQIVEKIVEISGTRAMRRIPIDPGDCLRVALALFESQIQQRGIVVETAGIDHPSHRIQGDPELLLQALITILHRSIASFGAEQKERRIRIAAAFADGRFELTIDDTGTPPQAFDLEEQIDPLLPYEHLQEGQIFNYTIPRSILRRHKGDLEVESSQIGGKRIRVSMPLAED